MIDKITDPVTPTMDGLPVVQVDTTPMVEKEDDLHPIVKKMLAEIEGKVLTSYTLADAIREGAKHSNKLEGGFVTEDSACALGAAYLAATARGYVRQ